MINTKSNSLNIQKVDDQSATKKTLNLYFLINYLVVLFLVSGPIQFAATYTDNKAAFAFMLLTFFVYSIFYLAPAYLLTQLIRVCFKSRLDQPAFRKIVYTVAIVLTGLTTLLLYANAQLFALYGIYINGFVLNLVMTPGGIASLGGSSATNMSFAAIAAGFILLQVVFLGLANVLSKQAFFSQLETFSQGLLGWKSAILAVFAVIVLHMTFAYDAYNTHQLSAVASAVPFYQQVSSRRLFAAMGLKGQRTTSLKAKGKLNYPIHPLVFSKPAKPYNIVWLVSESWRADMLNEQVMPNAWQFAQQSKRFTKNYSTGNGTRPGVFGMMMGMPASYWFQFLQEQKGAAIIDVMRQQDYQMQFYTSALFSYPEFDKTVFAQVPVKQMHALQKDNVPGWQNDRQNVSDLLSFIDQRDKAKPFFTFMFFESPHAPYNFPPESAIATPYPEGINYANLTKAHLLKDVVPIKNRYINAVHHLDAQFGRVFSYLKQHDLLENTIVVLVGDHGEEFMEHGYWGHNSAFVDEQVRTPLVIYMPKSAPAVVDNMTSHADIVPTLMPLLGVKNAKTDYSIGINLLSQEIRNHAYISDWDRLAYVDSDVKILHPVDGTGIFNMKITRADDQALSPQVAREMLIKKQNSTMQVMHDLTHFVKPKSSNNDQPVITQK